MWLSLTTIFDSSFTKDLSQSPDEKNQLEASKKRTETSAQGNSKLRTAFLILQLLDEGTRAISRLFWKELVQII